MKPASVTVFDYLFLGSLIVDLFSTIAGWDYIVLSMHNQIAAQGGGPDAQVFVSDMLPYVFGLGLALNLGLWMLISLLRIGFFRWILAIFVALGCVSLIGNILAGGDWPFLQVMNVLSAGMTVVAVYFIFRPDAGAWLRREI